MTENPGDWTSLTAKTWAYDYELRVHIPADTQRAIALFNRNPTFHYAVRRWAIMAGVTPESILTRQHAAEARFPGRHILPTTIDPTAFHKLHRGVPVDLVKRRQDPRC